MSTSKTQIPDIRESFLSQAMYYFNCLWLLPTLTLAVLAGIYISRNADPKKCPRSIHVPVGKQGSTPQSLQGSSESSSHANSRAANDDLHSDYIFCPGCQRYHPWTAHLKNGILTAHAFDTCNLANIPLFRRSKLYIRTAAVRSALRAYAHNDDHSYGPAVSQLFYTWIDAASVTHDNQLWEHKLEFKIVHGHMLAKLTSCVAIEETRPFWTIGWTEDGAEYLIEAKRERKGLWCGFGPGNRRLQVCRWMDTGLQVEDVVGTTDSLANSSPVKRKLCTHHARDGSVKVCYEGWCWVLT